MTAITSDVYSKYCYSINRNRPVIVIINNHGVYGYHAVVGYGYYSDGSTNVIVVNDGWGNNSVAINSAYIESVTYSID